MDEELEALRRRFERERAARREAESIAERVTGELFSSKSELERLNQELEITNQELQEVNQSMRDFVAVASHDLRSPLTTIIGWAQTMGRKWDDIADDKKRDFLGIIEQNGHHLARLVDDLLTISRIDSGALETQARVIELRGAMANVMQAFSDHAAEIVYDFPDELALVADADHLRRILTNYVGNALKYGGPPVQIQACYVEEWVEIRVCDEGPGVAVEFVPRLFGKFARGSDANTRSKQGTGLGLSIVQGLARANGGDTWYEPNQPHGSCFALRLPKTAA